MLATTANMHYSNTLKHLVAKSKKTGNHSKNNLLQYNHPLKNIIRFVLGPKPKPNAKSEKERHGLVFWNGSNKK